jgi:signal transduction histidine kinase/ligand-binding sensor domain-containing protein
MFFWICSNSAEVLAQSHLESGFPAIKNYSPKEYDAYRQNWVITQDNRGVMYFGNTDGLLEFDGNSWQLYKVPNKSGILGLAFADNGKLYAGAQGDLGYFSPDASGQLTFNSLLNFIPLENRDFSNVTETYVNEGKVYFNTEKYILIWDIDKGVFKTIESERGFHLLFKANETIYAREWGKGLEVLKNDTLKLVSGGEQFAEERIYAVLPFPDDKNTLLIATRDMGILKYDGTNFTPFKTEADQFIKENLIYLPGIVLLDGNFLLSTLNKGVTVINSNGEEINRFNQENGIINNTIYFAFQESSGSIWMATENGISRIDYTSPISYFDNRSNLSTITYDIIRHKGIIYAGTGKGVYSLDPKTSLFHSLKNSNSQSYSFLETENDLFVGTSEGLFKIESDNLIPIRRTIGNEYLVTDLIQSNLNPRRIFTAVNSGIWSVFKTDDLWIDEGQILKVSDQPTSLAEDEEGNLWLGTFSSGLFRVKFRENEAEKILLQSPEATNFDQAHGLQDGIVFAEKINGKIYIVTSDSIYKFNPKENRFVIDLADNLVSKFFELRANIDYVPLKQDQAGRIWLGNKTQLAVGKFQEQKKGNWSVTPLRRISDEAIYRIYGEKTGVTWFVSGDRYIRYDSITTNAGTSDFSALIRRVEIAKDSAIFFGGNVEYPNIPELNFKDNSIKFRYSATSYQSKSSNQFSSYLEGFEEDWSSWSTETVKAYTNLSPGDYSFKLKARNLLGNESSLVTFSFIILPAWYRTWWAYLFYTLVVGGAIYSIVQIRSYYLKKENRILEEKVRHRTRQLNQSLDNLKSTQAQLIQSEKMASLGELTAGIAHEIQNPLNFVNNFSEVNKELVQEAIEGIDKGELEETKSILKDLGENSEKINQHGKRADAIVKGMLAHSKRGSGQKEPTNLNALVNEILRLSYRGLKAKVKYFQADFSLDLDPELPKINVMASDIGRVILNLVNNAFYAVNEKAKSEITRPNYKPTVMVSSHYIPLTEGQGGVIELIVQDNGNGIPENIIEKIFQPFFTTKPTGSGTGLGLSLSYDIVKAHGGELNVNSRFYEESTGQLEEDVGTTFSLRLPVSTSTI